MVAEALRRYHRPADRTQDTAAITACLIDPAKPHPGGLDPEVDDGHRLIAV